MTLVSTPREQRESQPLRGRERELALIRERIAAARGGSGAVIVIEGRAGLGKTRLLAEAARMARGLGLIVGSGVVAARDQSVPMGALVSALLDGPEPLVDRAMRSSLPFLPEQRYWLLDEIEVLLEKVALRSPVLLCIDDMQWGDNACLTALRTLPVRLSSLPIVWLVAYRSTQISAELRSVIEGLEQITSDMLLLGPMSDPVVAEVVRDILGAEPDAALLDLVQRSHGSPFLLVELLHGLQDEGLIRVGPSGAELLETRLPARVRDGMRERLEGLSDLARRAALVASVLGRRFSFDQLSGMLSESIPALLGPVDELLRAELIIEDEGQLMFRHDLLREAVGDTLPLSARRALQRQAVDVLLATGAVPVDVAMQLASSAEPGDAAAVRTLHEASQALAASDPDTAALLSRKAFDIVAQEDRLRGTLAAETALLLHAAGRMTEGKEFADRILGELLPAEQEAEVRLSIARMLAISADARAQSGLHALALPGVSPAIRARHLATLVHNRLTAGRVVESRERLADARAAVEASADPNATFTLALAEAALEYTTSDVGSSLAMTEAALRLRHRADEPQRALLGEEWRTELLATLDMYDASLELTAAGLAGAHRSHQAWGVRLWERWRGRQLLQLGRLSDAAAALEVIVDAGGDMNFVSVHDACALVALARVAIHRGDEPRRRRCAELARRLVDTGPAAVQRHAIWLLALLAAADGDDAHAHRQLRTLGDEERFRVVPRFMFDVTDEVELLRIAIAAGDDDLARAAVESARVRAELNPGIRSIAGVFDHARGLARRDGGAFFEAISLLEQGPRPLALASALEDAGRTELEDGGRDGGVDKLGRALEIYARAGATWDEGRVRGRLRSLGVRRRVASIPTAARVGWDGLTESELAVVRLVVRGMTNREVAERLFVSPHTVNTHLRHAFEKLEVNSRVQLVSVAARHDVLEDVRHRTNM